MNVPIIFLSAFSIFLSLTLFLYNKGYQGANRFLAGYLFCSSFYLVIQYLLIFSKSKETIAFFITGFPSLFFLTGPFAYFYVRSVFRDNVKLSKYDYLHFVPFFIIFSGTLPFVFSSWEYKCVICQEIIEKTFFLSDYNVNFLVPKLMNQLIRPPFVLFYLILIYIEFIKNKKVFKSFAHARTIKVWMSFFLFFISVISLLYCLLQADKFLNLKVFSNDAQFSFFLNCVAFSYLAMNSLLILFPQILYGLPNYSLFVETSAVDNASNLTNNTTLNTVPSIEKRKALNDAFLSNNYELEIEKALQNWIAEKKYLEANASLDSTSTFTKIPIHHLSYYFNAILNVKYSDWRNTFRIEYAKSQIDSGYIKGITLEWLSLKCGFSSQSTFIRAFKNIELCTPREYVRSKNQ